MALSLFPFSFVAVVGWILRVEGDKYVTLNVGQESWTFMKSKIVKYITGPSNNANCYKYRVQ